MIRLHTSFLLILMLLSCQQGQKAIVANPQRIVSLSPAITRQIIDMGEEKRLTGVTAYHPPLKKKVTIVGSLNNPSIEIITSLKPDLVLFSREDSNTQKIGPLLRLGLSFYSFSRNDSFKSICSNYQTLGKMLNSKIYKKRLSYFKSEINRLPFFKRKLSVAIMVSHKPIIPAGRKSFIHDIIEKAVGKNAFMDINRPYPPISLEVFIERNPDIIISIEKNPQEIYKKLLKNFKGMTVLRKKGRIIYVDPGIIALYSPDNFVASAKIISSILQKVSGE